jgi:hypothetical protein
MLAQFTDRQERSDWKKMMIEAEIAAATIPRTARDRSDHKPSADTVE